MSLDAIIISDTGYGFSKQSRSMGPPALKLEGRSATIQVLANYLEHQGRIVPPIKDDGRLSWWSAPRYNGIFLLNHLLDNGFEVELINKYYEQRNDFLKLLEETPRVVIISTTFIVSKQSLKELVNDIRSLAPDIFIIVGGPFVYKSRLFLQRSQEELYVTGSEKEHFLFSQENEPSVDLYIIDRKGEEILCEVMRRIKEDLSINDIPNTASFVDGKYHFTRLSDHVLKGIEAPVDWRSLPDHIFRSGVLPMQASSGCPYNCAFCNLIRSDSKIISIKPMDRIIEELKAVWSRGVQYVRFVDDNFRLGKPDLKEFCQHLLEESVEIKWMMMTRVSTLKDVDAELLRRAGCLEVALGLESADEQILLNMNKKADLTTYRPVVRKLLAAGINCTCYFLFGFPGETDDTALRTRDFIKSIEFPELDGLLSWDLYTFFLSPLSPIYEVHMREKYGLTGFLDEWKHKTMDSQRAKEHIEAAYMELENSCQLSRGDNLEILHSLSPHRQKEFSIKRYRLAKAARQNQIRKEDILASFENIIRKV